jgi:hypothetical protein
MNTFKHCIKSLAISVSLITLPHPLFAGEIEILNPSFEQPEMPPQLALLPEGLGWNDLVGKDPPKERLKPQISRPTDDAKNKPTEGKNCLMLFNVFDHTVTQDLSESVQPGQRYVLKADVGNSSETGECVYAIELWAGTEMLGSITNESDPVARGEWKTVVLECVGPRELKRGNLQIRLRAPMGPGWPAKVEFDNVRLLKQPQ